MFFRISLGIVIVLGLAFLGGKLIWGRSFLHHRLATVSGGSVDARIEHRATSEPNTVKAATGQAIAEVPTPNSKLPVICLDPGHPSEVNPGTTLQNGLREVEVVYDVAMQLKKELEEGHIARVVMTRNFRSAGSSIVTNKQRAEIANKANAVLLLRLHCDTGAGSGCTIYFPDRTGKIHGLVGPSEKMT